MIEDLKYTKSLLKQASKYIEQIKCLDECKKCADFVGLSDKFPYLANLFFAMGMNRCYRSYKGDLSYPQRAFSECIGYADPYLGQIIQCNDVLEDLCAYEFYYHTNHRPWAIGLFACGYYIENKILDGKHFDLNAMKNDILFLSVFTKYYSDWNKYYTNDYISHISEEDFKKLKDKRAETVLFSNLVLSNLVELDIDKVPDILKERLSIIDYIIGMNSVNNNPIK